MLVELSIDHLLCRLDDCFSKRGIEPTERNVGARRRLLHDAERTDDCQRLSLPADLEVAERTLRLGAPIAVACDRDGPECIGFRACLRHL